MKEAILYEKREGNKVRCHVCNHGCLINEGRRGLCAVRENISGRLYALSYGKAIAVSLDPIEKKPLYHFLPKSLTYSFAAVGCNLRCQWCQNWQISQDHKSGLKISGESISPKQHVKNALAYQCPSISYTYTEPTIFIEYALETMKLAKKAGLKNIWVTNGYMSEETLQLILPYLDAANIDFKAAEKAKYQKYCGAKLEPILKNMQTMQQKGVHLEVTSLIVPGINSERKDLEFTANFIAKKLDPAVPWHISRFFPNWQMKDVSATPLETLKKARQIGQKAGLKHIYIGNI
jgi:pyruvate formate lyase activating enzyme